MVLTLTIGLIGACGLIAGVLLRGFYLSSGGNPETPAFLKYVIWDLVCLVLLGWNAVATSAYPFALLTVALFAGRVHELTRVARRRA